MVKLESRLETVRLESGARQLLSDLLIKIDGMDICVPKGFVSDFSSIPRGLRWIADWRRVDIAGVVHDWLFKSGSVGFGEANEIWRKVARSGATKANPIQAFAGYLGLMIGGWKRWRYFRQRDKK